MRTRLFCLLLLCSVCGSFGAFFSFDGSHSAIGTVWESGDGEGGYSYAFEGSGFGFGDFNGGEVKDLYLAAGGSEGARATFNVYASAEWFDGAVELLGRWDSDPYFSAVINPPPPPTPGGVTFAAALAGIGSSTVSSGAACVVVVVGVWAVVIGIAWVARAFKGIR